MLSISNKSFIDNKKKTTNKQTKTHKATRLDLNLPFELVYLAKIENQSWYYNQEFIWSSYFSFCFQFYSQLIWLRNFQISRSAFLLCLPNTFMFLVHFHFFWYISSNSVFAQFFWQFDFESLHDHYKQLLYSTFSQSIKPDTEIIFEIKWDWKSQNCLTN